MNIFVLDIDVTKCAEYHNDKHCVKMILETAQLLCGVHWLNGIEAPYKLTHKNHPCAIWVRDSYSNYIWLLNLGKALCAEYTYRYGRKHKCEEIIDWCILNKPMLLDKGITDFPLAMPQEYKVKSAIQSYRNYYIGAKKDFCKWTKRSIPNWFSA